MNLLRFLFLAAALAPVALPANLAISTYFKDGFTPTAIASDATGNLYIAGSAVIDPASKTTGVAVAKLDPKASQYLYLAYLDSAASDQVSGIAVDTAGDAFIAGWTTNVNFPVVGGGALGTAPTSASDPRSFVTKLNPQGAVVFSLLIGGSAASMTRGIALTPEGRILVSGMAGSKGFPATAGAYNVPDSTNQWFVMELDATGSRMIFSATGIGGSSIALDAAGNIYLAGSSPGTSYPTTEFAYQRNLVQGYYCFGLCQVSYPGNLQHVTKVDPTGSTLFYSTGLNDAMGHAGSTTTTGLAVDAAGDAYITGTLLQAQYPFTVTAPSNANGFLTKLDPTGAHALFSIPVGGAGVQLDSAGSVYAGGDVISAAPLLPLPPAPPPAIPSIFSGIPQKCQPNYITAPSEAYVVKVDPATGDVQDGQWIDGSAPGATGITLAGGKVWIVGATPGPEVPFTPGVLGPENLGPGFLPGAYLSAADFSGGVNTGPAIACVLDSANLTHVGAVAPFQLISLFGSGLGPLTGVVPSQGAAVSLAGVSITFDGDPAQLLYDSASQINVVVPAPLSPPANTPFPSVVMKVMVNGATVERQFPLTASNLNLFADLSGQVSCQGVPTTTNGFQPVATNSDGSRNSCTNPAAYGSTVALYVEGPGGPVAPLSSLANIQASVGFCSAAVTSATPINDFVYKVDVSLPASLALCDEVFNEPQGEAVTLTYKDMPVSPLYVPVNLAGPTPDYSLPVTPMPMIVWVKP